MLNRRQLAVWLYRPYIGVGELEKEELFNLKHRVQELRQENDRLALHNISLKMDIWKLTRGDSDIVPSFRQVQLIVRKYLTGKIK